MAETRHKSLPWKREGQYIVDALGCSVLTIHACRDARAHADMILSGVNSRAALVEACAETRKDLSTLVGWYAGELCDAQHATESKARISENGMLAFLAEATERIDAALALAEPAAKPKETQPCQE